MYAFIRIHGTEDVKPSDNKRRKIIREAATRHGGQSRSSRRHINQRVPRNPIFELEISTEPASSATIIPPIILPLDPGAGRHDPFVRYPVPMSIRMHEIIDQSESITDTPYSPRTAQHIFLTQRPVLIDPDEHFCGFRHFWLPIALEDVATFHQLLSNISAAKCLTHQRTTRDIVDGIGHHGVAVSRLAHQLSVVQKHQASALIPVIIACAQYSNICGNEEQYKLHFDALLQVLQFGGGLGSLDMPAYVRLLILFVEVNACARSDSPPRVPLPIALLPVDMTVSDFQLKLPCQNDEKDLDPLNAITSSGDDPLGITLRSLRELGETITERLASEGSTLWRDAKFYGLSICVLLHRLLSLGNTDNSDLSLASSLREATRLSVLIGLTLLRIRFRVFQVSSSIYVSKLRQQQNNLKYLELSASDDVAAVLLWQAFMLGIGTAGSDKDEEEAIVYRVLRLSERLGLKSWEAVSRVLCLIFWVDPVHSPRGRAIWDASRTKYDFSSNAFVLGPLES